MDLEQHLHFLFLLLLFLQIAGANVFADLVHTCMFGVLHLAGSRGVFQIRISLWPYGHWSGVSSPPSQAVTLFLDELYVQRPTFYKACHLYTFFFKHLCCNDLKAFAF